MKPISKKSGGLRLTKYKSTLDRTQILNNKSAFSTIEEYKCIRTNVAFSIPDDGCRVIGVTSADMQEGKSINCLNLAITFAQTGVRVLLIDCDLRLPKIALLLSKNSAPGLSNVLVGLSGLDEVIQPTPYDSLDVIFSGNIPPNPSELLGSPKMRHVLEELKKKYDYIFIDTPPVNVVSDAVVLSELLSGVILVVRSGISEKSSVLCTIEQLKFVNANIIGFILNAVTDAKSKRLINYYHKYENYDSQPHKSKSKPPQD